MAQLKVKQISDFVSAVGTIHNATVGTANVTAISTAKSEAISAAASDATTKANTAESNAAGDATTKANKALSDAKDYSDIQKLRIDALLLDSTDALDSFAEIKGFIDGLDTADIVGLVNDISTAKSEAIASAKSYTDGREVIINKAFADADIVVDSAAQGYASDAQSAAASDATTKANNALASAKTYADTAESDAVASAKSYTDTSIAALDSDLQGQIDALSGVNSDEVIALFVSRTSFDAGKVFNLNGGHVAVFVNGLQIHEAGEGVDGWVSENGQLFTVTGLGYDLENTDHIVVSGTLA